MELATITSWEVIEDTRFVEVFEQSNTRGHEFIFYKKCIYTDLGEFNRSSAVECHSGRD